MNKPEILITGGTGRIGRELVSLLTDANIPIRIFMRPQSRGLLPQHGNIEVVYGELTNAHDINIALRGIRQLFLLTRDQPSQGEIEAHIIVLAAKAGVEKIIKSSAFAAGLEPPVGYGRSHFESEQKLMASGLDWVILRPYMFMQNLLDLSDLIVSRGLMPLPMAKAKIGLIDARDVALVAKIMLTESGHDNKVYELTGPHVLSLNDCAEIFSTMLGRSIRYFSMPYWFSGLMMRMQGESAWDVAMRKQLFKMIADGGEAKTTDTVENLSGQKPRSLKIFAEDYRNVFQQQQSG